MPGSSLVTAKFQKVDLLEVDSNFEFEWNSSSIIAACKSATQVRVGLLHVGSDSFSQPIDCIRWARHINVELHHHKSYLTLPHCLCRTNNACIPKVHALQF